MGASYLRTLTGPYLCLTGCPLGLTSDCLEAG